MDKQISWCDSLDVAMIKSRSEKKPVLADFFHPG
jgi:hypothetical protein